MATLSFETVRALVDALEFELERERREAAHQRALRALEGEGARPRRTARASGHHRRPGTPNPSGAR